MAEVGYEVFRDAVLRIHPGAEEKDIKAAYTLAEGRKDVLSAVLKRLKELKKERRVRACRTDLLPTLKGRGSP